VNYKYIVEEPCAILGQYFCSIYCNGRSFDIFVSEATVEEVKNRIPQADFFAIHGLYGGIFWKEVSLYISYAQL